MIKLALLGPEGTFSQIAALKYLEHKKEKAQLLFKNSVFEIFEAVKEKEANLGLVPFENSLEGSVRVTLDELFLTNLHIQNAILLSIEHALIGKNNDLPTLRSGQAKIKIIYSHPQAFAQCYHFLKKNYPKVQLRETFSTTAALRSVKESKEKDIAAVGPAESASLYNLLVLKRGIQDNKNNVTRFIIISPHLNQKGKITSLALYGHKDRPGLLHDLLGIFAKRKINLTRIESRPAKLRLGDYIFYLDFEGELADKKTTQILTEIKNQGFKIKVFGAWQDLANS